MLHILDILGAFFSFFSTLFYVLAWEACWPIGVVATIINGSLYGLSGIYGDMCLEVIYFFSMFYGWYKWRYGGKGNTKLAIAGLKLPAFMKLVILSVLGILVAFVILKFYTNSTVPELDSVTTVLSLCAQWLMCVKILETWIVWFVVDAVYVYLYFDKALPFHSVLLIIYLGMALVGYWRWRQLLKTA